ncbi:hypothetical protein AB85_4999 [Escherichia coli 2-156-04_S3_C1]|nr:hypothetical protein AB85_4999 [Escherichia coli 2-156-04_S3_C1]
MLAQLRGTHFRQLIGASSGNFRSYLLVVFRPSQFFISEALQ